MNSGCLETVNLLVGGTVPTWLVALPEVSSTGADRLAAGLGPNINELEAGLQASTCCTSVPAVGQFPRTAAACAYVSRMSSG